MYFFSVHRFRFNNSVFSYLYIYVFSLLISVLKFSQSNSGYKIQHENIQASLPGYSELGKGNRAWSMLCHFASPAIQCLPLSELHTCLTIAHT